MVFIVTPRTPFFFVLIFERGRSRYIIGSANVVVCVVIYEAFCFDVFCFFFFFCLMVYQLFLGYLMPKPFS